MEKLIITAAITGSGITRDVAPHIPITSDEIIQSAIECWNVGAAIVHIHVRDPKTGLRTQDLNLFRQVVEPLREKTDLVLCLTTSGIPGRNLPMSMMGLIMGGHVRVGMEDNIYYQRGVLAASNALFVERIVLTLHGSAAGRLPPRGKPGGFSDCASSDGRREQVQWLSTKPNMMKQNPTRSHCSNWRSRPKDWASMRG